MRFRGIALVATLTAGILGPIAVSDSAEPTQGAHSANLTFIKNLPQKKSNGQIGGAGSDIEFITADVTGLPQAVAKGVTGVREFALAGSLDAGMQIVDITDPENPTTAAVYDCKVSQGDIQVFTRNGRQYATYAADYGVVATSKCYTDAKKVSTMGNNLGTFIVDLTNPYAPTTVSFVNLGKGSHNMTVHPSGLAMYNSNNELAAGIGKVEIVDIADLAKPKQVGTLDLQTGIDSHDISFSTDGKRAYVAAITHSLVLNTETPLAPTVVGRVFDPSSSIHHQFEPIDFVHPQLGARRYAILTDEVGGGSAGSTCPGGALHVYDVTGPLESAPVKVGVFEIPVVKPAGGGTDITGQALGCTSHVLRFYPAERIMTIAWYNAGVHVVDISSMMGVSVGATDPRPGVGPSTGSVGVGMKELGYHWFPNSDTWSAKTNKIGSGRSFYLFGNDMNRGLDVYKFAGDTVAPAASTSEWAFTPGTAWQPPTRAGFQPPYCTLRAEGLLE